MNSKPSNVTSITDMQDEAIRLIDLQKEIFEKIRDSKHLASKKSVKKDSDQSFEFFTPAAIQTKLDILEASLSRSCPRSLFEDTSGGQLLASHSASHVSPRLFLLGAALGRGNTARVDRPCQAQQMLRNLRA